MTQRHQIGEQGLRLVLAQAIEVEGDVRARDQLGAQLRRQMRLAVSIERVGAHGVAPGQRRHRDATRQPQVNRRAFAVRAAIAGFAFFQKISPLA